MSKKRIRPSRKRIAEVAEIVEMVRRERGKRPAAESDLQAIYKARRKVNLADDVDVEKAQYEADTFAALCLFPQMDEETARMLKFRLDLFKHFNL